MLLLASAGREDWIVCQITSNPYSDQNSIALAQNAFAFGGLRKVSYVRPGKLFTAHQSLIVSCPGELHLEAFEHARDAVVAIIRGVAAR